MADQSLRDLRIKGVQLAPLRIIPGDKGDVLRLLRPDSPILPDFPGGIGEIYFSEILPGMVKAWKMHERQTQLFSVPMGQIRIALYDMRAASPSLRVLEALNLGRPDHYNLLKIPPGIWYGFKCVSQAPALICNCPDLPHDPGECQREPWDSQDFPYSWAE